MKKVVHFPDRVASMRVYIENHGCTNNQHLGERLGGKLISRGCEITGNPREAQVIVLNTCTVKARTERRMLGRIRALQDIPGKRRLVVAGCMPTIQSDLIAELAPDSLLYGTYEYDLIPDALIGGARGEEPENPMHHPGIGICSISTGCQGTCTFCIVRLIKGRLRSFPEGRIIREIDSYRERGAHEVWLTSQDLANYGNEMGTRKLPQLLGSVLEHAGTMKVRMGMMNPENVTPILDELLEVYRDPRVYKFAHLPVQSGDDGILQDMGRRYCVDDWRAIVRDIRNEFPRFTISTDVIVGFPSEGEEQFRSTLSLIEETRPDIVNLSRYEHRPGTPASGMKALQGSEVKRRSREATRLIARVTGEVNDGWVGWSGRSLVSESGSRGGVVARNDFYKPIIIGEENELGSEIELTIAEANENYLIGYRED